MRSDARAVIFIIIMERKNVYGIEHCFVYVFFYGGLILMTRNIYMYCFNYDDCRPGRNNPGTGKLRKQPSSLVVSNCEF